MQHGLYKTQYSFHTCANNYACAHKIDGIKPIIQSTHICTRRVYDSLQAHMCMSVMHVANLECVHFVSLQIISQGQWFKFFVLAHVNTNV